MEKSKPFLRWAGSKRILLPQIVKFLPNKFNNYHEPFLGSGSLFFYLVNTHSEKKYYLSDINDDLINAYLQLKERFSSVKKELKTHKNEHDVYYKVRALYTRSKVKQAAKFLFLNRTSFNGIYRVNTLGEYNVPYGYRNLTPLFDYENLKRASNSLKKANIDLVDFAATLSRIKKNDLVFLDPPYTAIHENNGFIHYNQKLFKWSDQIRLQKFIEGIVKKKAFFILTNAKHFSIYQQFSVLGTTKITKRHSSIGGKGAERRQIQEYLFTNINPQ